MKTKTIFKMLAAAMLMPAMLLTTACSNSDDEIVNTENPTNTKGYALPVTINVTRQGDATTRATFDGSKLSFSEGDKLFVRGYYNDGDYTFAGMLDYVSDGTFSGTIMTQTEWTGTIEGLLGDAKATLLPAGYGEYGYLSIADGGTYKAYVIENYNKAFATSKATAVEQFSYEWANSYSNGFALSPQNAIVSFTISGLAANTEVAVLFKDNYDTSATPVNVTTDATGVATFASAMYNYANFDDYSLTVDGNAITLPENKEVEAGKIYNISRSVAPAGPTAYSLAESTVGMIVGSDGKAYAAADKNNLPSGVTVAGLVAYKNGNNGLAIALTDETSKMDWYDAMGESGAKAHTPAVTGQTWKLPSNDDIVNMLSSYDSYWPDLNGAIVNVGGTGLLEGPENSYWLSDESDEDDDEARYMRDLSDEPTTVTKGQKYLVRSVIAF